MAAIQTLPELGKRQIVHPNEELPSLPGSRALPDKDRQSPRLSVQNYT
jgi:hypothetical protein